MQCGCIILSGRHCFETDLSHSFWLWLSILCPVYLVWVRMVWSHTTSSGVKVEQVIANALDGHVPVLEDSSCSMIIVQRPLRSYIAIYYSFSCFDGELCLTVGKWLIIVCVLLPSPPETVWMGGTWRGAISLEYVLADWDNLCGIGIHGFQHRRSPWWSAGTRWYQDDWHSLLTWVNFWAYRAISFGSMNWGIHSGPIYWFVDTTFPADFALVCRMQAM